ncbi:hypothetical protein EDC01DRAFT_732917 [Geopyxis carbonaria]|nr:hypothetical protein EDC01DRAFT_732917 [Geopyxis carbonaria]
MLSQLILVLLSIPSSSLSLPVETLSILSPCGVIQRLQQASNDANFHVSAQLARDCLTSVPLNATNAVRFIGEFRNFMAFQSTLAWARDLPSSSYRQQVDFMGGLDNIVSFVERGLYENNYEFEEDLRVLINKMRDGHLAWQSMCLEGNFGFQHDFALLSMKDEEDGGKPKVFYAFDIIEKDALSNDLNIVLKGAESNRSAIKTIDGTPVEFYLMEWALRNTGGFHDPDAIWNSLLLNRQDATVTLGSFTYSPLAPLKPTFKVVFENGTSVEIEWEAIVREDLLGIENGDDYSARFCNSDTAEIPIEISDYEILPPVYSTKIPGYPDPMDISLNSMMSSYLLPNTTIGVLAIHTFMSPDYMQEFQDFVSEVLLDFDVQGVTKIIIDVTGNSGGNIVLGYDVFRQFFPDITPYGTTNIRAHPAAEFFYHLFSEYIDWVDAHQELNNEEWANEVISHPFSYRSQHSLESKRYTSWEEAYGPHTIHGDNYTSYFRWDLDSPYSFGHFFQVTNESTVSHSGRWGASDIFLLGNGMCSSTCTLFAEAMRAVGVPTVAYGGRPRHPASSAPHMQFVGGVEGSQVLTFEILKDMSDLTVEEYGPHDFLPGKLSMPIRFPEAGTVNLRNSFRKGEEIPLEFVYTPASMQLPVTEQMIGDAEELWRVAARAVWGEEGMGMESK